MPMSKKFKSSSLDFKYSIIGNKENLLIVAADPENNVSTWNSYKLAEFSLR